MHSITSFPDSSIYFFCNRCKSLNVIYFTTITKQVIQLILIMLVGTDVCIRMVFVWEETGVPGANPPVWLGDHMTISHDAAGYRTRVADVRGECVNTAPARQPHTVAVVVFTHSSNMFIHECKPYSFRYIVILPTCKWKRSPKPYYKTSIWTCNCRLLLGLLLLLLLLLVWL